MTSEEEPAPSGDGPVPSAARGDHDGDEPELEHEVLRQRARLGILWLLVRTVVLQVAVLGGTVVLARVLEPADFGLFGIAQFAISFFLFFGDAGLGGALIQKRRAPTQRELSSVFLLQIGIALVVLLVMGAGAPWLRLLWPDLPVDAEWVFRALSFGLLLTVLRVIPQILMERQLLFGRLAVIEVASQIGFYGGAAVAALQGAGVWALVIGALLQGGLATVLALAFRPWRPSLVFDREALRPILRFGIPFQAKNLIGFVNAAITPVYAGATLGASALGFIQWAQTTAYFPLKLVTIMGRVTFPLYSRIADDRKMFAETLGRSLAICAFGVFFFVGMFFGLGRPLIHIVFTDKWLPALPLLHIYTAAIAVGFISPVAAAALDAAGKPQIIAKMSVAWTALNWVVVLLATPRYGIEGFAVGYSVHVVAGNLALLVVMLYVVPGVRTLRRLWASVVAGGAVYLFGQWAAPHAMTVGRFIGAVAASLVLYGLVVLMLDRRGVRDAIALVPSRQRVEPAPVATAS